MKTIAYTFVATDIDRRRDHVGIIFAGRTLCPAATLYECNGCKEMTIFALLKPHKYCIDVLSHLDSRLQGIYCEKYPIWILTTILNNLSNYWNNDLTRILYEYAIELDLNVYAKDSHCQKKFCMPYQENNVRQLCEFCNQYSYAIPTINLDALQQNFDKYYTFDNNNNNDNKNESKENGLKFDDFYGLFVKLKFIKGIFKKVFTSDDEKEDIKEFIYDINGLNNENINNYIIMVEPSTGIKLKFAILSKETIENGFLLVLKINQAFLVSEKQLREKMMQGNGKLQIEMIIKENDLPTIYTNVEDKGDIIADMKQVKLRHAIFTR